MSQVISISTTDIHVPVLSAVYDLDRHQLVAVTLVATHLQNIRAVTATLMTNSRKFVELYQGSRYLGSLENARKRGIQLSGTLAAANAEGVVHTVLHPLTGNPAEQPGDYFYVVVTEGEDLATRFGERLNLAIPWPVQTEWSAALLEVGLSEGLVERVECLGPEFSAAICVHKSPPNGVNITWRDVIEREIKTGQIAVWASDNCQHHNPENIVDR